MAAFNIHHGGKHETIEEDGWDSRELIAEIIRRENIDIVMMQRPIRLEILSPPIWVTISRQRWTGIINGHTSKTNQKTTKGSSMKPVINILFIAMVLAGSIPQTISAQDVAPARTKVIKPIRNESFNKNGTFPERKLGGNLGMLNNVLVFDGANDGNRQVDPQIAVGGDHVLHGTNQGLIEQDAKAATDETPTLRVLTYNIHHGRGTDGKFDYERMAKVIAGLNPDVIALQEVDNKTQRASGVDIAEELGKRLKMNHVFGNALYFSGGQYGEAVLSRFPIADAKAHHLPYRFGNEPRTALEVRVTPDNEIPEFTFVGTHLCHQSSDTRWEQTQELDKLFSARSDLPVIMAGDLNARPGSKPMQVLLDKAWIDAVAPKSRIDYVLLRKEDPWEIVETIIVDEPIVSDHDPILTILKWTGK